METAPFGSFAQIMASSFRRHGTVGRLDLEDHERFEEETLMIKQRLEEGTMSKNEIESAIAVYRLVPHRMEMK